MEQEKEEIDEYLTKLVRFLNKKEKNRNHDRNDLDYYGIRDIESLFVDVDDYYKPISVKTALKEDKEDESGYGIGYKLYESRGDKDKNVFVGDYLEKIKSYLRDFINSHKTTESGEWKIQLNMHVNFISSYDDIGETHNINILSDYEKIMWGYETDDIINNLFISFKDNYQLEEQIMREGSDFKFASVDRLDYKPHKIKLKRGGLYVKSPDWIRNKKGTINPKNEDDNCFQFALTGTLNYQNIENHPEKISNIELFIDQYNWAPKWYQKGQEESEKSRNIVAINWKKFERNNETIALNILYVPHNKKEIVVAYQSKNNRKRENQVILLMITDGEKYHYFAVKTLLGFLHGITSNDNGDFTAWVVYIHFALMVCLKNTKDCVVTMIDVV